MLSPNWFEKAIIYELYVDKFAGNFSALTSKLDYFKNLGVNTLWLLPHYPSPLIDGGYDISDYQNIRPTLGTLSDFDQFVATAHTDGLKIIIDMVLNHTSDQYSWFKEARSSKNNPKRNWYLWSDNRDRFPQAFVHFADHPEKNGKNWIFNQATGDYYYATFYPGQPDLNWDNPEVKNALQSVMDFWLDRGVDGFRLDAVSRLVKRDGTYCFGLPETHQILKDLRRHIDQKYPGTVLLAEAGGWPDEARAFFGEGGECQLVMHFPLAVKMLSAIASKNTAGVSDMWRWTGQAPAGCSWTVFLTNHDSVDLFFLSDSRERQQLIDQGNSRHEFSGMDGNSFGARLGEICRGNKDDIIWATKLLLDQPGVPIIYYGNEIGMMNQSLPEKPADMREYVRGPFDWEEAKRQQSDPGSLFSSVSSLIKNRRIS